MVCEYVMFKFSIGYLKYLETDILYIIILLDEK